jgi:hypothetical protein
LNDLYAYLKFKKKEKAIIERDFDFKDLQQVFGKQCKASILEGYKGANKCKSK